MDYRMQLLEKRMRGEPLPKKKKRKTKRKQHAPSSQTRYSDLSNDTFDPDLSLETPPHLNNMSHVSGRKVASLPQIQATDHHKKRKIERPITSEKTTSSSSTDCLPIHKTKRSKRSYVMIKHHRRYLS